MGVERPIGQDEFRASQSTRNGSREVSKRRDANSKHELAVTFVSRHRDRSAIVHSSRSQVGRVAALQRGLQGFVQIHIGPANCDLRQIHRYQK